MPKKSRLLEAYVHYLGRARLALLGAFFGGVLLGGVAVWQTQAPTPAPTSQAGGLRESSFTTAHTHYTFIDPLVATKSITDSPQYSGVQKEVAAYIAGEEKQGLIAATVYFRDIDMSGGFTLNPNELYTPASLNKVPVMIAYYKIAETNPSILSEQIVYPGTEDSNAVEEIRSAVQLSPGGSYTVEQLIEHMIRYSDNNAADLLTAHLKDTGNLGVYTAVFSDLGIDPAVLSQYTDNVSAQKYAIFLRALYNATYLNRDDSERALKLLSETDFSAGIESGVPNDVLVAQKFGEVRMTDPTGVLLGKELNDCGIIYYPGHPYLLCVMTKMSGDNVKGLESEVASISRIIYRGMQGLYP